MSELPRVALTLGDPAGIGPELVARLLSGSAETPAADVTIVAGRDELEIDRKSVV